MIRLVSVSGGKDSTATLLLALERHPKDEIRAAFCDTGNEHEAVYEYIHYLQQATGVEIKTLQADFSEEMQHHRERLLAIANGAPDYINREVTYPWTPERAREAAEIMYPTGNPYLDLCLLKGMFPKRRSQFCTEELKVKPSGEYQLELLDQYGSLELWQGVRADESRGRALLAEREEVSKGVTVVRPIHKWTVEQVFEQHRKHGIKPNPLYMQGMNRVGCMPCINARKDEILEIGKRFPQHIERIARWERLVSQASRSGSSTFFPYVGDGKEAKSKGNIFAIVEWSKTRRGGKEFDWIRMSEEPAACQSAYGLCE